jgi:hypothetical protein
MGLGAYLSTPAGQQAVQSAASAVSTPKNCPDGPSDCEKQQQLLERGKQALLNWKFTGLSLPERVSQAADYNEQVRELNLLIALHNQKCPANRVEPLQTVSVGGKPG